MRVVRIMSSLTNLGNELGTISLVLLRKYPFYGILLKNLNVYYDPVKKDTSAYVYKLNLYLTSKFLELSKKQKLHVIFHELNHILLKHSLRTDRYYRMFPPGIPQYIIDRIVNYACDAKANQYNEFEPSGLNPITPRVISLLFDIEERIVEEMSTEEIIELFLDRDKTGSNFGKAQRYDNTNDIGKQPSSECNLIQKGDESESTETQSEGELEKKLMRKIMSAYTVAKTIGKLPGGIERLVGELLKPKVNWKVLLRNAITKGLGKNVKRTWTRPSRKYFLFPGKELLKVNKVITLIDDSGSITEQELQRFVSEVYGIARESSDVIVISWDAKVQDEFRINRESDVKRIKIVHGGGGTKILPALQYALKKYASRNIYVIFTDWHIDDIYSNSVIEILKKINPICATSGYIPHNLEKEGLKKNFIVVRD